MKGSLECPDRKGLRGRGWIGEMSLKFQCWETRAAGRGKLGGMLQGGGNWEGCCGEGKGFGSAVGRAQLAWGSQRGCRILAAGLAPAAGMGARSRGAAAPAVPSCDGGPEKLLVFSVASRYLLWDPWGTIALAPLLFDALHRPHPIPVPLHHPPTAPNPSPSLLPHPRPLSITIPLPLSPLRPTSITLAPSPTSLHHSHSSLSEDFSPGEFLSLPPPWHHSCANTLHRD